jgi:hypothetical protein
MEERNYGLISLNRDLNHFGPVATHLAVKIVPPGSRRYVMRQIRSFQSRTVKGFRSTASRCDVIAAGSRS